MFASLNTQVTDKDKWFLWRFIITLRSYRARTKLIYISLYNPLTVSLSSAKLLNAER